jgi:hypothetical protein
MSSRLGLSPTFPKRSCAKIVILIGHSRYNVFRRALRDSGEILLRRRTDQDRHSLALIKHVCRTPEIGLARDYAR